MNQRAERGTRDVPCYPSRVLRCSLALALALLLRQPLLARQLLVVHVALHLVGASKQASKYE